MTQSISRRSSLALVAAAPLAVFGTQTKAANHTVRIKGFAFSPAALTIAAGDTVTFINEDSAPHTATATNNAFDTGRLNGGESAQIRFQTGGQLKYTCKFHPNMKAKLIVE